MASISWSDALAYCKNNFGTSLASIEDEDDNTNVQNAANLAPNVEFAWIGLTDQLFEGSFIWIDSTCIEYQNWEENAPNNPNVFENDNDCVYLNISSGLWNDTQCDGSGINININAFICNRPGMYTCVLTICTYQLVLNDNI